MTFNCDAVLLSILAGTSWAQRLPVSLAAASDRVPMRVEMISELDVFKSSVSCGQRYTKKGRESVWLRLHFNRFVLWILVLTTAVELHYAIICILLLPSTVMSHNQVKYVCRVIVIISSVRHKRSICEHTLLAAIRKQSWCAFVSIRVFLLLAAIQSHRTRIINAVSFNPHILATLRPVS